MPAFVWRMTWSTALWVPMATHVAAVECDMIHDPWYSGDPGYTIELSYAQPWSRYNASVRSFLLTVACLSISILKGQSPAQKTVRCTLELKRSSGAACSGVCVQQTTAAVDSSRDRQTTATEQIMRQSAVPYPLSQACLRSFRVFGRETKVRRTTPKNNHNSIREFVVGALRQPTQKPLF